MARLTLKPLRDLNQHNVVNFYKLNQTGAKGMPVVISSGWDTSQQLQLAYNLSTIANVFSPRFAVKAEVRPAVSGEKPFGITLYNTESINQWGEELIYDQQYKKERQAVVSGDAVPILRQGYICVGPWATGESPAVGRFTAVATTGDWGILSAKTGASTLVSGVAVPGAQLPIFGEFLGQKDADSYTLVYVDCTF